MEGTEPASSGVTTGRRGNQEALVSTKPLHRFIQREPKSLGIVFVICGCAEILMGFPLASEDDSLTSYEIYIPFWQGALFLISGNLSIYTEGHPSKKMVTVCLSMYLVSFFGILVSFCFRIYCLNLLHYFWWRVGYGNLGWANYRIEQLSGVEGLLFVSSLCVSVLLIFMSCVARSALKSTRTQVIVHCVPAAARRETTAN